MHPLQAAKEAGAPVIGYGMFVNTVINFLIVAFAVFMLVKWINQPAPHDRAAGSGSAGESAGTAATGGAAGRNPRSPEDRVARGFDMTEMTEEATSRSKAARRCSPDTIASTGIG